MSGFLFRDQTQVVQLVQQVFMNWVTSLAPHSVSREGNFMEKQWVREPICLAIEVWVGCTGETEALEHEDNIRLVFMQTLLIYLKYILDATLNQFLR